MESIKGIKGKLENSSDKILLENLNSNKAPRLGGPGRHDYSVSDILSETNSTLSCDSENDNNKSMNDSVFKTALTLMIYVGALQSYEQQAAQKF